MADFDMITERVATGGALTGDADVAAILAAGINVVVDARADFDDGPLFTINAGVHYLWNPTPDDGEPKPVAYWQRTLSFVLPLLALPKFKVLCHCQAGQNRGPSNAFAVLVAQGLDPWLAAGMIRTARPQVTLRYEADALAACCALGYVDGPVMDKDVDGHQLVQVQFDAIKKPYAYAWAGDGELAVGDTVQVPLRRGFTVATVCALGSNYSGTATVLTERADTKQPPSPPAGTNWW